MDFLWFAKFLCGPIAIEMRGPGRFGVFLTIAVSFASHDTYITMERKSKLTVYVGICREDT